MENRISTNIEQSKHLLELGLDPNTADMYYTGHRSIFNPKEIEYTQEPRVRAKFVSFDRLEVFFPAWSLSALLEVMRQANAVTTLQVTSLSTLMRCKDMGFIWQNDLYIYDPTTAAYEMVCYLLRNNLIEKGVQDGRD